MRLFKSSKLKIVVITFLLLLCTFCTILTAAAFYVYNSNKNIPYASDLIEDIENAVFSEDQFDQMMAGIIVDSLTQQTTAEVPIEFQGLESDFSLNAKGVSEGIEMILTGDGTFKMSRDGKSASLDSDLELDVADMQFGSNFDFNMFMDNKVTDGYFKFSEIPAFLSLVIPGIEQFNDKWLLLSQESTSSELSEEQKQNLTELINSQEFFDLIKREEDRIFGDIRANCAVFSVNQNQFNALSNRYKTISGESLSDELGVLGTFQMKSEMCFGRRDYNPYYIDFSYVSNDSEFTTKLDNFRYPTTPVVIEKPEADFNLNELLNIK